MKRYAITLKPLSGFGTPLKGDTLFGHFCWQAVNDPSLVEGGLEKQLTHYSEKPFVVFSSAFAALPSDKSTIYALKRPDLPFSFMLPMKKNKKESMEQSKAFKEKRWLLVDEHLRLDLKTGTFADDKELLKRMRPTLPRNHRQQMGNEEKPKFPQQFSQAHNTINRLSQTTGPGAFAPYTRDNFYYYPETELVVFVFIEETATDIGRVTLGLERIGMWGFGRDASTGLGRFKIIGDPKELPLPPTGDTNAFYILAPCVLQKDVFKEGFFTPFVRYGKHGDRLANVANPFKNPVIMADEGAVFIPHDNKVVDALYIGRAVANISKAMPETVVQGYAPCLPLQLEI